MYKIIFSTYDDIKNPYYGGGGAIAIHELAKRLSKRYDITVISWNHSGKKKEVIDGVRYERIGSPVLPPKLGMFIFQLTLPLVAKKLRGTFNLWVESFTPPFTTSFLPLFIRKPVIGVAHMMASEDMKRKYKLPVFSILEKKGIKNYKTLVATSTNLKNKLLEINPDAKVHVIENGVAKIFKNVGRRDAQMLFLGRIEIDQKGIDLLIETFNKVKFKIPDMKLVIAGSGLTKETDKLKRVISASNNSQDIKISDWVKGEEKEELLKSSFCMVVPSRFETFSMVALEALAYSLPLFCFDIEGLKWIPDSASFKTKNFDTSVMAKKIVNLYRNKNLAKMRISKGIQIASNLTWNNIADKYNHLLNEI